MTQERPKLDAGWGNAKLVRWFYSGLRPGWTETSTIRRKRLDDGTDELELIDYESLCIATAVREESDHKTFRPEYDRTVVDDEEYKFTAFRHLWWQCVFTAYEYTWAVHLDVGKRIQCLDFAVDLQSGNLNRQFWGDARKRVEIETIESQRTIKNAMVLRTLRILRHQVPGLSG